MKHRTWKIAGINFDHFHMGDLLRYAQAHPHAEVVGISDEQPARMEEAIRKGFNDLQQISKQIQFTRTSMKSRGEEAYLAHRQAEVDLQYVMR